MPDKIKFARADALNVAEVLKKLLEPHCERIEIAGSLRRGKSEVSDIEILYVSKPGTRKVDLLETEPYGEAEKHLDWMLYSGVVTKRPNKNGVLAWGGKNKLAIHVDSGIPVDFFATTIDCWWVALVIRTGSKETNLRLTTGAQRLGRTLHAYGAGVEMPDGKHEVAESEQHVFEMCNVPYLLPEKR